VNKNNFHITENTKRARYKLWMLVKWEYVNHKFPRKITRYSFNTKSDATGLKSLLNYVENRKHKIEKAQLRNNQTDKLLKVFNPKSLAMEDAT
jgi:hypothetical protein